MQVIKRTEAFVGTGRFRGFDAGAGKLLDVRAPSVPWVRI